ncbi:Acetyltransferase [Thalassocella blandensis]|nr:Acetyltransferase [Thalassocella blandensis]
MAYSYTSSNTRELFELSQISWQENLEALSEIRRKVFVEEQGVSADEEWDGLDELNSTLHFHAQKIEASDTDSKTIATARVLEDGKIGRMCVLQEFRGHGIGKALLQEILNTLIEQQRYTQVYLYAQISAQAFYESVGFQAVGNTFMEAGIEHIRMELDITNAENFSSIYEDRVIRLHSMQQFEQHLQQLIAMGRYTLDILTHHLNPQLFTSRVADEISKLARNHRQSQVRILVEDTKTLVGISHPVVQLSQRLSSSVEIKKLNNGPDIGSEAFTIIDRNRLLFFNDETALQGFARYNAAAECEHQLQNFEHLWQTYGIKDPELSRLYL